CKSSTSTRCGSALCASAAHASMRASIDMRGHGAMPDTPRWATRVPGELRWLLLRRAEVIADANRFGGVDHESVGHVVEYAENHQQPRALVRHLQVLGRLVERRLIERRQQERRVVVRPVVENRRYDAIDREHVTDLEPG